MNIYETLSDNLIKLRKSKGLTQADLAEILKFSDKSVSKWETGMSYPSIDTLAEIAEFYNVTIDDLCLKPIPEDKINTINNEANAKKFFIKILSISIVFLIATTLFVYSCMTKDISDTPYWQVFVWAVPLSALVVTILDLRWRQYKYLFIDLSVFSWTLIASLYCQFLEMNLFLLFVIGAPIQIIILLIKSIRSENFMDKINNIFKKKKKIVKEKSDK